MKRWILTALLLATPAAANNPPATATIFAAASLSDVFREAGRQVTKRAGYTYRFHFAGSQQLAAQLEQGAPADIFAAADDRWMSYANEHNLIDGAAHNFARNRLVVITPVSNPGRVDKLEDLARSGVKVLIGTEGVPAGRYARQVLSNLSKGSDFGRRVLGNVVFAGRQREEHRRQGAARRGRRRVRLRDRREPVHARARARHRHPGILERDRRLSHRARARRGRTGSGEGVHGLPALHRRTGLLARYGFLSAGNATP
jgi:hypothetical protein